MSHLVSLLLSQRCTFLFDLRRVSGDVYLSKFSSGQLCMHFSTSFPRAQDELCPWYPQYGRMVWPGFINLFCNMRALTPSLSCSHAALCLLPEVPQSSVACLCFLYIFKVALHKHRLLLLFDSTPPIFFFILFPTGLDVDLLI